MTADRFIERDELDPPTLTVVIPTYRRPGMVSACLSAVLDHAAQAEQDGTVRDVRVLVIDNDAEGGARAEVSGVSERVRYLVEPTPGIAAVRARALAETDTRLVSFIDDDEVPQAGWLSALLTTWRDTGATAVSGRVDSFADGPVHPWIIAGGLFDRPRFATGTRLIEAAAGNLLLDAAWVRAHGLTFDPRLGLGGGEDSLFTRQLVAAGGTIVWCDESAADDPVPAARTSRRWLVRRFYSQGHASVIVDLLFRPERARVIRLRALVGGLARAAVGGLWFAWGVLRFSPRDKGRALRLTSRGAGMVAATMGATHYEYSRPQGDAAPVAGAPGRSVPPGGAATSGGAGSDAAAGPR